MRTSAVLHARVARTCTRLARSLPLARSAGALRVPEDDVEGADVPTRPVRRSQVAAQHLEQIGPLVETFPTPPSRSPIVIRSRASIQSAITMLAYGDRVATASRRPEPSPNTGSTEWSDSYDACVRDRELVPDERSVDVVFHEFMADDMATVETIYRTAGTPLTDEAAPSWRPTAAKTARASTASDLRPGW